jgi:hypothetical protein
MKETLCDGNTVALYIGQDEEGQNVSSPTRDIIISRMPKHKYGMNQLMDQPRTMGR